MSQRILVAITGASGSIYAQRLIDELMHRCQRVYVIASRSGKQVVDFELPSECEGFSLRKALAGNLSEREKKILRIFQPDDFFAPVASGSSVPDQMIVIPCSMGTLARINHGISDNLIGRAADVILKQKKPLILCPRETPLNTIHLQHMLSLSQMGCHIVPAMPAFYQKPQTIDDMVDFMVGRALESLGLDHKLYKPWNTRMI